MLITAEFIWCQDAHGVRMLLGLTSVTVHLDSLETTVNSTLMSVPVSPVSVEVYVWMEETTTSVTCYAAQSGFRLGIIFLLLLLGAGIIGMYNHSQQNQGNEFRCPDLTGFVH